MQEKLKSSSEITNFKFISISCGVVGGMAGMIIMLPLFLAAIGDNGPYFILSCNTLLIILMIWPARFYRIYKGIITSKMREYDKFYKIIIMAFGNFLNNLIVTPASHLKNTPGALQALLQQFFIPFTVIISKLVLKKQYFKIQYLGALITFIGCLLSIGPSLLKISDDDFKIIWPIIYIIGLVPGVAASIIEESIFQDFPEMDYIYLLSWDCFIQFISSIVFFWSDIIPGYGSSESFSEFFTKFGNSLICFLSPWNSDSDKCNFCSFIAIINALSYVVFFLSSSMMFRYASATSNAIISAFAPIISICFFIIFKSLNTWAGGQDYSTIDIIFYFISVIIISVGVVIYRKGVMAQIKSELEQIDFNYLSEPHLTQN